MYQFEGLALWRASHSSAGAALMRRARKRWVESRCHSRDSSTKVEAKAAVPAMVRILGRDKADHEAC